ncbi:MAG: hypothetical protein RLZZ241_191 [Bacteroidota bacterium]|jgi:CubicO group peptidase (beta-lactamase class C family)
MKTETILTEIDTVFRSLIAQEGVPGLAVQINFHGDIYLQAAYGCSDVEHQIPATPQTVFRAASLSKSITVSALARMIEMKLLQIDDGLKHYVPEYPHANQITLRQLAGHSSGIRSYRGKEQALNLPLTPLESLGLFKDDPLEFLPGTSYSYSSYNYVLLGLAMERAVGLSLETLIKNLVLDPFNMQHTRSESPGHKALNEARSYTRFAAKYRLAPAVDTRYKLAGGGFLTTVGDLCNLGTAYLKNEVASSAVLDPFFTPQVVSDKTVNYGLGWQLAPLQEMPFCFGHEGSGIGAFGQFYVFPKCDLVYALLVNCNSSRIQLHLNRILKLIGNLATAPGLNC